MNSETPQENTKIGFLTGFEKILRRLSSLKITVSLFAYSMFLVFIGTLAQRENGIWTVVDDIFRSGMCDFKPRWLVPGAWVEKGASLSFLKDWSIPVFGGFTLGIALYINLLSAHMVKFRIKAQGMKLLYGILFALAGLYLVYTINAGLFQKQVSATVGAEYMRVIARLSYGILPAMLLYISFLFMYGWRKAAVILIHFSVFLLMFSEVVTHSTATESTMIIEEGQNTSFIDNSQKYELAIIEDNNDGTSKTTCIPWEMLKNNDSVKNEQLPFELSDIKTFKNTKVTDNTSTPGVTEGLASQFKIENEKESNGVSGATANMPGVFFTVKSLEGKDLGRRANALWFYSNAMRRQLADRFDSIEVNGKTYRMQLRFKREYLSSSSKPSERANIALQEFRFDRYNGTSIARNFSSTVHIDDPEKQISRTVNIYMNNPLRYNERTYYQSAFLNNEKGTVLQVVHNSGWMLPYIACMMAGFAMAIHFILTLVFFMKKMLSGKDEKTVWDKKKILPTALIGLLILSLNYMILNSTKTPKFSESEVNYQHVSTLPVLHLGRTKPFDSLARNSLRFIRGTESLSHYKTKEKTSATKWLLEVISDHKNAEDRLVWRITNDQLIAALNLDPKRPRFYYSLKEIEGENGEQLTKLWKESESINPKKPKDAYERQVLELNKKHRLYEVLRFSFTARAPSSQGEWQGMQQVIGALKRSQAPLICPDPNSKEWQTLFEAYANISVNRVANPQAEALKTALEAYKADEVTLFNKQLIKVHQLNNPIITNQSAFIQANIDKLNTEIKQWRDKPEASEDLRQSKIALLLKEQNHHKKDLDMWSATNKKVSYEAKFNRSGAFFTCSMFYMIIFVCCAFNWIFRSAFTNRALLFMMLSTFFIHSWALISRIMISGYPPITNLYSSAVFIGWFAILAALVIELIFKKGIGNAVGSVIGFATLLVAHYLSLDGDTMTMMQAVLDTRFFLATHVVAVAIGYSATFFAGVLGVAGLITRLLKGKNAGEIEKILNKIIYGITCFAIFFSLVGTVLGGIWADDSWGRFWGWDPKENGALLIVLWNAIMLHARWGGIVRLRGFAVLAIFGNIVTAWSWFGTNQLGIGLHSYGGATSTVIALVIFCIVNLAIMCMAWLPAGDKKLTLSSKEDSKPANIS